MYIKYAYYTHLVSPNLFSSHIGLVCYTWRDLMMRAEHSVLDALLDANLRATFAILELDADLVVFPVAFILANHSILDATLL